MYIPIYIFQIEIIVKNCKFRMTCVEKYDGSAFDTTRKCWICKFITAVSYEICIFLNFPGFSLISLT